MNEQPRKRPPGSDLVAWAKHANNSPVSYMQVAQVAARYGTVPHSGMIIIAGTIDFDSVANRDRAIEVGRPLQQATRDDEPGCEALLLAPDPCLDTRIQV